MKRAIAVAVFLGSVSCPAVAFDNIEVDAAYNGPIKEQIEKEFRAGLQLLKGQAEALRMEIREQDLTSLAQHMYDKATVTGDCMDQQITRQKMSGKKPPTSDLQSCIDKRLKFMSWLQMRRPDGSMFDRMFDTCISSAQLSSRRKQEPPYSFLKMEVSMFPRVEYSAYERCFKENVIFRNQ